MIQKRKVLLIIISIFTHIMIIPKNMDVELSSKSKVDCQTCQNLRTKFIKLITIHDGDRGSHPAGMPEKELHEFSQCIKQDRKYAQDITPTEELNLKQDTRTEYRSLLHQATYRGRVWAVQSLLAGNKENINQKDKQYSWRDETPVEIAIGNYPMLKFLLEQGANPDVRDKYGNTLAHRIYLRADYGTLTLLLKHGVNFESLDGKGQTPFKRAMELCNEEVVDWFIDHKDKINLNFDNEYTFFGYKLLSFPSGLEIGLRTIGGLQKKLELSNLEPSDDENDYSRHYIARLIIHKRIINNLVKNNAVDTSNLSKEHQSLLQSILLEERQRLIESTSSNH